MQSQRPKYKQNGTTAKILAALKGMGSRTANDIGLAAGTTPAQTPVYLAMLVAQGRVGKTAKKKGQRQRYWLITMKSVKERKREKALAAKVKANGNGHAEVKAEKGVQMPTIKPDSPAIRRLRREALQRTQEQPRISITIIASASQAEQILHRINKV